MNPKTQALQEFVEEQLDGLPDLHFRRMFGGFGIYAGDRFFGILHGENLYFHTDETTRPRYEAQGMGPFITPGSKKTLKRYFQVPPDIIESRRKLALWTREAIATTAGLDPGR